MQRQLIIFMALSLRADNGPEDGAKLGNKDRYLLGICDGDDDGISLGNLLGIPDGCKLEVKLKSSDGITLRIYEDIPQDNILGINLHVFEGFIRWFH